MEYDVDEAVSLLDLGDDFREEVKEVIAEFGKEVTPMVSYRIYHSLELYEDRFVVENTVFSCGRKVSKALLGSESIAVIVATVGSGVESLIKKYNDEYDFIKAYWCDKLSNWMLDGMIVRTIEEMCKEAEKSGMHTTSNWGPGYCGWNIREQSLLLPLSDASDLGITLSSSMLMNPVKSMSGVIGIGKNVVFRKSGCADCNLQKCAYRSVKW